MTWYELFLFIHIAATVVWVGSGFLSLVLALTYYREEDEPSMRRFLADQEWLAMKLFVPASMVTFLMGLALVIESDAWGFDQLWIVLGLIGWAATFFTGFMLIRPTSEAIGAAMEKSGGRITDEIRTDIRKLLVKARLDYVVLTLVILDMVAKPTGDNVILLIVMGAALVAGIAFLVTRLKAIDAERSPAAAPAA